MKLFDLRLVEHESIHFFTDLLGTNAQHGVPSPNSVVIKNEQCSLKQQKITLIEEIKEEEITIAIKDMLVDKAPEWIASL